MEAATVARRAAAPARTAPRPGRHANPGRSRAAQLVPIAVGTAAAVRQIPDSTLMVRMTRGRIWIGVLGVLLAGIVGLNVFTLSLAATAGHVDQNVQALEKENSILRSRDAKLSGATRVRHDAGALGLQMAAVDQVTPMQATRDDVATAAARLAAAGG